MDFTEFINSITDATYQVEGKAPKCKKGYRWDKNIGGCVPIGSKNKEDKSQRTDDLDGYNVIGSNGMDGGYALAEPPTQNEEVVRVGYRDRYTDKQIKANQDRVKKTKDRLLYGKAGKPTGEKMARGEYKLFDKESGTWVHAQALPKRDK